MGSETERRVKSPLSATHLGRWIRQVPLWEAALDHLLEIDNHVFVVGGTVRDALLGRSAYDLDLAIGLPDGQPLARRAAYTTDLAKRLADRLGAAYVLRDAQRGVARIVHGEAGYQRMIDLAALRDSSIERDLSSRDFTVNAMAVPLSNLEHLIDPLGGYKDLEAGCLRMTSVKALSDDPLRLLRAVRLAGELGFSIEDATARCISASAPQLVRVSSERLCEELFKILAFCDSYAALERARSYDLLNSLFGILSESPLAFAGGIVLVDRIERLYKSLSTDSDDDTTLFSFGGQIDLYLQERLAADRTHLQLLKLAALLTALPLSEARSRKIERLSLSRREEQHIVMIWKGERWLDRTWNAQRIPLSIYRYYRAFGKAGVNGALLALVRSPVESRDRVRALLRAWFMHREERINVSPLLSGDDVMAQFDLSPGPLIGRLLESLCEAQVQGLVQNSEQAKAYLREIVGLHSKAENE